MEESNCNSYLQEVQERGPRELQADQPHLEAGKLSREELHEAQQKENAVLQLKRNNPMQ